MSKNRIGVTGNRLHGVIFGSDTRLLKFRGILFLKSIVTDGPESSLNRNLTLRLSRHDVAYLLSGLASHEDYREAMQAALNETEIGQNSVSPRIAEAIREAATASGSGRT